jgi:hypothetical protein
MTASDWVEIVSVNPRGELVLPVRIRESMRPDSPAVRMSEVGPDRYLIEIVDVVPIADRWFHSEEWQRGERQAQDDIDQGRVRDLPDEGLGGTAKR